MEAIELKLKKYTAQAALDLGISVGADRVVWEAYENESLQRIITTMLLVATQESPIYSHPSDWWQTVKQRWFPEWLKRRYPVKQIEVVAVHKFPELAVPSNLGREFVHLKTMDYDEFLRIGQKEVKEVREIWVDKKR